MYAELAHAGQTYNEEVPYSAHLQMVVDVLARFELASPMVVTAAWLHDCIEDTNRSYNDIKKRFGKEVAELVYAVTSELGRNRTERNEKTYPKIRGNQLATALKLADRIANVEYGQANGGKGDMYAREFPEFRRGIATVISEGPVDPHLERVITRMWAWLARALSCSLEPIADSSPTGVSDVSVKFNGGNPVVHLNGYRVLSPHDARCLAADLTQAADQISPTKSK
jgi:hypothetical protein